MLSLNCNATYVQESMKYPQKLCNLIIAHTHIVDKLYDINSILLD